MGFRFRRSLKILPGVRINLSGSGASVSLGARGFHYTLGPKGTRVTFGIPGTGMSWTQYSPHSKPQAVAQDTLASPAQFSPSLQSMHAELVTIENASAGEINGFSTSQLPQVLNSAIQKFRIAVFVLLASVLLFVAAILQANQLWMALSALYATIFVPLAIFLDRYRRSVKVVFDSQGVVARITEALAVAFRELAACKSVWTINAEGSVTDWKRNAGATGQVLRTKTKLEFTRPSCMRGRSKFPTFKFGTDEIFLLPDSAMIVVNGAVAVISYRDLILSNETTRFIEEGSVPYDATIVDHTWRYVNKAGGPDRRFSSNRQIPICLYSELGFGSKGGLNCKFQLSNPTAANSIYKMIEALRRTTTDLPQAITYVQTARRWPTVVFLSCAMLLGFAQFGFLRNRISTNPLNSPHLAQTTLVAPKIPNAEAPVSRTTATQTLSPPLELKPPVAAPADDGMTAAAGIDTQEPLDLRDIANVRWVQSRLREFGFLRASTASWDVVSRLALRDFKAVNNIGSDDKWDFKTEELLASGAALRADQTFVGAWSETGCDARSKPDVVINSRRATSASGGVCEFSSLKYAGASWSVGTTCSNAGERWSATIHLAVNEGKLIWTGRDGSETQYFRCR